MDSTKFNPSEFFSYGEWYYNVYLKSDHWRSTRLKVLQFSNFKCNGCRSSSMLNVHHLTYKNLGHEEMNDLMVLCRDCHKLIHMLWDLLPCEDKFPVKWKRICTNHFLTYANGRKNRNKHSKCSRRNRNHRFNKLPMAIKVPLAEARKKLNKMLYN